MSRSAISAALLLCLTACLPALAQETGSGTDGGNTVAAQANNEEQAQDAVTAPGALPLPEPQRYTDWTVQCATDAESGAENCVLFQHLTVDTGQRLMTMQVSKLPPREGQTESRALVVTVPLGVHLPSGMRLQVDDAEAIDLTYERCDQGGCYAGSILDASLLESLMKGNDCRVTFNNLNGKSITATMSLSGFTAGYRAVSES